MDKEENYDYVPYDSMDEDDELEELKNKYENLNRRVQELERIIFERDDE